MKYTFEMALVFLKQGKAVCRECEFGYYKMLDGRIVYEDVSGYYCEARFTSEQLLAEDWKVLE